MADVKRRGAYQLLSAAAASRAVRVIRAAILARLLTPDVFGAYALIGAVIGPFTSLGNVGLTGVLAREAQPTDRFIATARWASRTLTVFTGLVLVAAVAGWSFLTGHSSLLLPGLVVAGATTVYLMPQVDFGLLQQRNEFGRIGRLELLFDLSWTATAVVIAATLRSVWAFALAELFAQIVRLSAARRWTGPMPSPRYDRGDIRHLLRFSGASLVGSLLWSLVFAAPTLLMQRHQSVASLGQLSLAYTYSQIVATTMGAIAGRIALPALARAAEHDRLRLTWEYGRDLAIALAPITGLLATVGYGLFVQFFGQRWTPAAGVFPLLVWGMAGRVGLPLHAFALASNKPSLPVYMAAATLVAYAALEGWLGWSDLEHVAYFIAGTDLVVNAATLVALHRLYDSASAPRGQVVWLWFSAAAGFALSRAFGTTGLHLSAETMLKGAVCMVSFTVLVLLVPGLRARYLLEATFVLAKSRSLSARIASYFRAGGL